MTHSMTAFARVQRQFDAGIFCWEIKSVNHRYLDVSFRLPESFRFLETSLRTLLRDKVSRGKLECQLKFQASVDCNQSMLINEKLVNDLLEAGEKLATKKFIANDLSLSTVLAWPGIVEVKQPDTELLGQQAEQLFEEALRQLLAVREAEGKALKTQIEIRLKKLDKEIQNSLEQVSTLGGQTRDKLFTRLNGLQLEVDNTRVEQEIALLIARADVSEELDRLQIHVKEVAKALGSNEVAGRRLDFLMQELNREANTLSSKSDSIALTQSAVEMKVLIEQMREQIQNIE
ncbi:YicC/YloC family endoribonuclease [Legionella brunensis]|uniref:Putative stress-induced protein n=1 Tax=Legionella brunensis TaxID=29422 RepID=A0A0W0S0V9_9GAMM|nr:YicC/YloC family endoribonuclease [Legionella brunensis]KTC77042.1 putative stress-induced protein [Legionella brunensis]